MFQRALMRAGLPVVALSTSVLLAVAASGTAQADATNTHRVDTYVLPVGAPKPDLHQLAHGQGLAQLSNLAQGPDSRARLARETVGPAASYAPRSAQVSGRSVPYPISRWLRGVWLAPFRYQSRRTL